MKNDLEGKLLALDDYVRGHDANEHSEAFEEDLFGRALAGDAPELALREAMEASFRDAHAHGALELWLTAGGVERLKTSGLRVIEMTWTSANRMEDIPDLSAPFDVLVTRVPFDLEGARRVDVEMVGPDGRPMKTMPEVTFDPADGAVYACCTADLARLAATRRVLSRIVVTDASGQRRVVAELPT